MIRSLECTAPVPILLRGERDCNRVNDPSCLHDEAPMNIPEVQGLESFQAGGHVEVLGE